LPTKKEGNCQHEDTYEKEIRAVLENLRTDFTEFDPAASVNRSSMLIQIRAAATMSILATGERGMRDLQRSS
jgi:hypothetical protein